MVDADYLTRHLIARVPAYALLGIHLLEGAGSAVAVTMISPQLFAESSGVIHAGALVTLLEASGVAMLLAVCGGEGEACALGWTQVSATLDFRLPARGQLVAECMADDAIGDAVRQVTRGQCERARVATLTEVRDSTGAVVCGGTLRWNLHRRPGL